MINIAQAMPEGPVKAATLWLEKQKMLHHGGAEDVASTEMGDFIDAVISGTDIEGFTAEHLREVSILAGKGILVSVHQNPQVEPLGVLTGTWLDGFLCAIATMRGFTATYGDIVA